MYTSLIAESHCQNQSETESAACDANRTSSTKNDRQIVVSGRDVVNNESSERTPYLCPISTPRKERGMPRSFRCIVPL